MRSLFRGLISAISFILAGALALAGPCTGPTQGTANFSFAQITITTSAASATHATNSQSSIGSPFFVEVCGPSTNADVIYVAPAGQTATSSMLPILPGACVCVPVPTSSSGLSYVAASGTQKGNVTTYFR